MFGQIFAIIQVVLKLIGLWDQFLDWSDQKRVAEAEERRQKREQAISDLDKAKTDEDIFNEQTKIVNNKP